MHAPTYVQSCSRIDISLCFPLFVQCSLQASVQNQQANGNTGLDQTMNHDNANVNGQANGDNGITQTNLNGNTYTNVNGQANAKGYLNTTVMMVCVCVRELRALSFGLV